MARPLGRKTTKPNPKKTVPKFKTLRHREAFKVEVAKLDLQGFNQYQIADKLDVSQATIHTALKEINQDYQDTYVDDRKRWVMKATAAHLDVIRIAQEELAQLQKKGKRSVMREEGTTPGEKGGPYDKKRITKENPEVGGLLTIIQHGWQEIASLHGLKELPAQIWNVQVNNNTVNIFDQLYEAMYPLPAIEGGLVVNATPKPEDATSPAEDRTSDTHG